MGTNYKRIARSRMAGNHLKKKRGPKRKAMKI
jgi:hypothetical protein